MINPSFNYVIRHPDRDIEALTVYPYASQLTKEERKEENRIIQEEMSDTWMLFAVILLAFLLGITVWEMKG